MWYFNVLHEISNLVYFFVFLIDDNILMYSESIVKNT